MKVPMKWLKEYVNIDSLLPGLKVAAELMLYHF